MSAKDTPALDAVLNDIETLREGCKLLEDIKYLFHSHYDFLDVIKAEVKRQGLSRDEELHKLYGHDGLISRIDRHFNFDDSE